MMNLGLVFTIRVARISFSKIQMCLNSLKLKCQEKNIVVLNAKNVSNYRESNWEGNRTILALRFLYLTTFSRL